MAFGDNMKESFEKENIKDSDNAAFMESLLNDENPDCIQTNRQAFHEERIRRAPKIVQDYYAGKVNHFEKGLFRVLVAKKSNRVIFLIMLFCLVIVFINGQLSGRENLKVVNGYECELKAFSYDEKVYANVKIHPLAKTKKKLEKIEKEKNDDLYFPVQTQFYGITKSEEQVSFEEVPIGKIFEEPQIFRTSFIDCDIIKVVCTVTISGVQEELLVKVSHSMQ